MVDYREKIGKSSRTGFPSMQTGASGSDVTVGNVSVEPSEVSPDGEIIVTVLLSENVYVMGAKNHCYPDTIKTDSGYSVEVDVSTGWGGTGRSTGCIPVFTAKSGQTKVNVRIPVGSDVSEGEYNIDANVSAGNSGDVLGSGSTSVNVSKSGSGGVQCTTDVDCGDGYVCEGGTCVEGEDNDGGSLNVGRWIISHPVESGVGLLGFSIIVNQLTR